MQSGTVSSNGIELFYESRGPETGEPIVFVMGLSAQMVFWPDPLLDSLAERGYRVIRFDNRDVGKSSRIRRRLKHGPFTAILRGYVGLSVDAPYTLHDMVDDTVGLLDALEIERAHLVGASMGGMISQLMAGKYPDRVHSLTSIMSSNNSRLVPPPKPAALKTLVGPRVKVETEEQFVEFGLEMMGKLAGTLPQGKEELAAMYRQCWARGINPLGIRNQFLGIVATGALTPWLKKITCPATVIHGSADPLIPLAGGKASARHIRGAKLSIIPGMGHDFPPSVLDRMGDLIAETAVRGGNGVQPAMA
ncbi:alpha/beta fold hydrolase [Alcanivorax sp. DP30]|uniref:alpha/beta fold hydrolase n=1 Tax=Alcanivorax sp. DP30 TaxID=2606217 RepID=UPI00136B3A5F|nr:alpha/beta hydrolase [Alcanivorax sp. DP30]MZR64216.1 alpha/beta fold hydrolase [Alcanivorax sp. DP30]